MKIEIEVENVEDFFKAVNHATVAYSETVGKNLFFGITDTLPNKFYKAWKNFSLEQKWEIYEKDIQNLKKLNQILEREIKK